MRTPGIDDVAPAVAALRQWQGEGRPLQLHPGDIGWFWRHGPERAAAGLRVWTRDDRVVAVGLLDGPDLLRIAVDPELHADAALAGAIADDAVDPAGAGLAADEAHLEVPNETALRSAVEDRGWLPGSEWTVLRRDLAEPVPSTDVRMELAGPRAEVVAAAVDTESLASTSFQADRWRTLAASIPFSDARCFIAHDAADQPVAVVSVWCSRPGGPGLIAPLGVEPAHRGRGFGTAIVLAGCSALRELGSSSVLVAAESTNLGAIRTYVSAGFVPVEVRRDLDRPAPLSVV